LLGSQEQVLQETNKSYNVAAFASRYHKLAKETVNKQKAVWMLRVAVSPRNPKSQRGLTEEMSKYVHFLHSESRHSLPTQPTDTILALNES